MPVSPGPTSAAHSPSYCPVQPSEITPGKHPRWKPFRYELVRSQSPHSAKSRTHFMLFVILWSSSSPILMMGKDSPSAPHREWVMPSSSISLCRSVPQQLTLKWSLYQGGWLGSTGRSDSCKEVKEGAGLGQRRRWTSIQSCHPLADPPRELWSWMVPSQIGNLVSGPLHQPALDADLPPGKGN